jgi:glucosamine--fructose-6-phosphate aminotransferase (isomerizing)
MCGVIGYVGRRHAKERLLKGLERLEYRGYDSAGICLVNGDGPDSVKAVGKLVNLKAKVNGHAYGATTGIGHTRWATHGRVTEQKRPSPLGRRSRRGRDRAQRHHREPRGAAAAPDRRR